MVISINNKWITRSLTTSLILLVSSVLPVSGMAQPAESANENVNEPDSLPKEPEDDGGILSRTLGELDRTWRWLEEQRDEVSHNVSVVGRYLDDWLAGEVVGERSNQSYLRLTLNQRVGRFNNYHSNARISGRVDLPRAAKRWKLIFESENVERESLRDQRLNNVAPSSFTGGFRYELPERNGWRFSHDIGVRGRLPLDPFYRFRIRYGAEWGDNWYTGFNNRIFYYHHRGWGQDTRLFFSRAMTPQVNLRIESEVNYRHDEGDYETRRLVEFGQAIALHQSLGEYETMTYEVGLIGRNRPDVQVDNYYTQMLYRKAIYEDWLVMEVSPQLLFEKDHNWQPDPRVQLSFEIYFFDF